MKLNDDDFELGWQGSILFVLAAINVVIWISVIVYRT